MLTRLNQLKLVALEDEFGIHIPDEETEKLATVSDLVDYVKQALEQDS